MTMTDYKTMTMETLVEEYGSIKYKNGMNDCEIRIMPQSERSYDAKIERAVFTRLTKLEAVVEAAEPFLNIDEEVECSIGQVTIGDIRALRQALANLKGER